VRSSRLAEVGALEEVGDEPRVIAEHGPRGNRAVAFGHGEARDAEARQEDGGPDRDEQHETDEPRLEQKGPQPREPRLWLRGAGEETVSCRRGVDLSLAREARKDGEWRRFTEIGGVRPSVARVTSKMRRAAVAAAQGTSVSRSANLMPRIGTVECMLTDIYSWGFGVSGDDLYGLWD
jgi:hypothetical protein